MNLEENIRKIPLVDRLEDSLRRVQRMYREGQLFPGGVVPRVPATVQPNDDDYFIQKTLNDAMRELKRLKGFVK
ncbi:MAG: hypothetical protein Q8L39_13275 [Burkholderiales bacterium]|nr:hypothetical protein [Burkholderiales bacterium]